MLTPQQETQYWELQSKIEEIDEATDFLKVFRSYNYCPDYYERMKVLTDEKTALEQKQLDLFNHATNATT